MVLFWEVHFLSLALYLFDIIYAIDRSLQKMSHEIEARHIINAEDGSLRLTPDIVELLKSIANDASDNTRLLSERSGETNSTPPSSLDLLGMVTSMVLSVISTHLHQPNTSCYEVVGCFNKTNKMSLPYGGPMSPEAVGTVFYFFNNRSRTEMELTNTSFTLANWTLDLMTEPNMPLILITHGFTGDITTPWLIPLLLAFLDNVHSNVIVVDWRRGAAGPNYPTAVANTPMVGAEISMLLQKIINATNCTLHPDNITLNGFSLGAHVMGFAGRHFYIETGMKLGRITGLDPAGVLFDDTDVALSREDAKYVDIIHTNGGDIMTFKLGLRKAMGHVDFYPNGGSIQPNCSSYPKIHLPSLQNATSLTEALIGIMDSMACSHYRAPVLLAESLTNHHCNFTSYPCPGGWKDFKNCSEEFKHNETVKGLMGYYSFTRSGRGLQYLKTNATSPYCIPEKNETAAPTANS